MARLARPNTTREELERAIMNLCEEGEETLEEALYSVIYTSLVNKDLRKIESEFENVSCEPGEFYTPGFTAGWDELHGFAVLWIALGGDAEQPFAAVLYLDNKNRVRAYIPKDGNCYDKKHKVAYGCAWSEEYGEELGVPYFGEEGFDEAVGIQFDDEKLRADAAARIEF